MEGNITIYPMQMNNIKLVKNLDEGKKEENTPVEKRVFLLDEKGLSRSLSAKRGRRALKKVS